MHITLNHFSAALIFSLFASIVFGITHRDNAREMVRYGLYCFVMFLGGVFVAESVSVIIQRSVFKYRKMRFGLEYAQTHRVFKRAPLHHHFEQKGWAEPTIVFRFWIIAAILSMVGLATLKLR